MNRQVIAVIICLAVVGIMGNALGQEKTPVAAQEKTPVAAQEKTPVAGMSIGVSADELVTVAKGWSAKNQIMGKNVYNDKSEKVGAVDDLIIAPDKAVTYAIIGTGGFLGMEKHDVAIPISQLKMAGGMITLPGATKDAVEAMHTFQYAK
jgi:sporulation protein YlmC with PRC-barrel domain